MIQSFVIEYGGASNVKVMLSEDVLEAMDKVREQLELALFSLDRDSTHSQDIDDGLADIKKALELIK